MKTSLGLDFLSPASPLGFLVLIIGLLFSAFIFYILFNLDKESESERNRRLVSEKERSKKIQNLYPSTKKD